MRIILGKFNLEDEKVRADWGRRALTADLAFRGRGKHDRYQLELSRHCSWAAGTLFHWAAGKVASYEVFPPTRMRARVDAPGGWVVKGANILIGVYVTPFRLRMADRVVEVFEGDNEKERWSGFTYGTLEGHAEKGIETFRVAWDKASGKVFFSMEAWSWPGHWLTWLFYPWARWVQKKAGREAVKYFQERLEALQAINEGGAG